MTRLSPSEGAALCCPGPRIPPDAGIENGPANDGDRHVVVCDKTLCTSYELYAIRITASRPDRSCVRPPRHQAGSAADSALPPMGLRLRRKSGSDFEAVDASGLQKSPDWGAAAPR
ncbi:hypothetical protein [Streptomyces nojiriensis]|uniref:hypothetical protein n=1 Tax=Streptomyces nojiriensis TaxID=66374 RepID=UPI003646A10D